MAIPKTDTTSKYHGTDKYTLSFVIFHNILLGEFPFLKLGNMGIKCERLSYKSPTMEKYQITVLIERKDMSDETIYNIGMLVAKFIMKY